MVFYSFLTGYTPI